MKSVKSVLFSTHDDFFITAYLPMRGDVRLTHSGRDEQWKKMANASELAGLSCIHLGGDSTVTWLIEVDQGLKGEHTGVTNKIRADGGDMQGALVNCCIKMLIICVALSALTGWNEQFLDWKRDLLETYTQLSYSICPEAMQVAEDSGPKDIHPIYSRQPVKTAPKKGLP